VWTANQEWLTCAGESHDVVLSSGFLAFAQHSGFLQAVEEVSLDVAGVIWAGRRCGGQLAGSEPSASHKQSRHAAAMCRPVCRSL
jgi:hypothetical protein